MNVQDGLEKIEEESKKYVGVYNENAAETFREIVLETIFLDALGYKTKVTPEELKKSKITIEAKVVIKITLNEIEERSVSDQLFSEQKDGKVIENLAEWGILINPRGIWLFNNKISSNKMDIFRNGKTVLEIIHGKNRDQKYFNFFSYENIVGNHQNTNYFRDIIEYKNHHYKGNEKSWSAYHSALKRFFKFYSQEVNSIYFKDENGSVYDKIRLQDFYWYVKTQMKVSKESTLKNAFFYIKNFMHCMSANGIFDIGTNEMIAGFSRTFEEENKENVIDRVKLRKAVEYLKRGKNKERDVALFLLLLAFGLERRKICLLKWGDVVHIEKDKWTLQQEGREVPIPQKVIEALQRLRALGISEKYVFYRTKENKEKPMREAAVNEVFGKLVGIDPKDSFYRLLTPANIRSSLIHYLLDIGCPLEEITYLVNIEIWNLGNYFSRSDIDHVVDKRNEKGWSRAAEEQTCKIIHPMESFFNKLLS